MKRAMCLWFPLWPIQRLRQARPELKRIPIVLYEAVREKMMVALASPQAQKQGVKAGMPVAEAKALAAGAAYEPRDAEADAASLRRLALWCQCFSPWVAAVEPDSLLLDITGCGHIFGGEEKLARQAAERLFRLGFVAKAAIAQTAGGSWALAHYAPVVLPDRDYQTLESLPVEALRLEEELLPLLRQFDIRTIGQLRQLPRPAVHARFGLHLLQRLDQAFGDISEPLTWEIAQAPTQASWSFEWPCSDRRSVETALEHLLTQMLAKLVPQQLGIQRLQCTLQVLDGRPHGFTVGLLHANNSLSYLMGMLRLHLDRVQPPAEITGTLLEAKRVVPLEFQQGQMFAHDTRAERWRRVPALIEILSNRLGKQAVLRPRLLPEAQPELAWRYEPWLEQDLSLAMPAGQKEKQALLRPLVLQASAVPIAAMSAVAGGPPLRFSWQRRSFTVARHWGPERIETGWWRGRHVRRDYYLVETTAGERFWLFRAVEDGTWYLHGVFA